MPWTTRKASNYKDCLSQVRDFTQKTLKASAITHVTGSVGIVYGASASENSNNGETWTLTCTTAGADGTAVFTVAGDAPTTAPNATAGTPYSIDEVSFLITALGGSFSSGDKFTFTTDNSSAEWIEDRWDTDWNGAGQYELIQHGIGSGADEIYVGYQTVSNNSTYWNLRTATLTGFNDHTDGKNKPLSVQPAYDPFHDCMNDEEFDFTCIFNSRHIKIMPTTVTGEQGSSYAGWYLPHATASQYPYPAFVGGSSRLSAQAITNPVDSDHNCWWHGVWNSDATSKVLDGGWRYTLYMSPRSYGTFTNFRTMLRTGDTPLFPCVPINDGQHKVYGEIDGVYYPSPYSTGLLSAGDVVTSTDLCALCFKNVSRGATGSIIAMDLIGD